MAKKLVIFIGAALVAAAAASAVTARKHRAAESAPLLEPPIDSRAGKPVKQPTDWRSSNDAISPEFANAIR